MKSIAELLNHLWFKESIQELLPEENWYDDKMICTNLIAVIEHIDNLRPLIRKHE